MNKKRNALYKSTEELTELATLQWNLLTPEMQKLLKKHIGIINKGFTEIKVNSDLLPDSWNKSPELIKSLKLYLESLQKSGRLITSEVVKACINEIHLKVKDDVKLATESYNYSTIRCYPQPYVPNKTVTQLTSIDALPLKAEIREAFESSFSNQTISDNLILTFINFNKWAKDNLHQALYGKKLYYFTKELSKICDNYSGKVFTALKYLHSINSLTLPPDYNPILNWSKKQSK